MASRKSTHKDPILFSASNFRSISDLTVVLPRFSVLVGPNSAGKTNLIDAMMLLGDLVSHRSTRPIRSLGWQDVIRRQERECEELHFKAIVQIPVSLLRDGRDKLNGSKKRSHDSKVSIRVDLTLGVFQDKLGFVSQGVEVRDTGGRKLVSVEIDRHGASSANFTGSDSDSELLQLLRAGPSFLNKIKELLGIPAEKLGGASDIEPQQGGLPEHLEFQTWFSRLLMDELESSLRIRRIRLDATSLKSEELASRDGFETMESTGRGLALAVERLRGNAESPSTQFAPVLKELQRVYPRIEDVIPRRITRSLCTLLVKERGIAEPLEQSRVSDGVLHALALYISILEPYRGTLAIEEPENALHPWAIRSLVDTIQNSPNRIILTTHSEVVVNAIRDPASLFIVEQGDGGTTITPALEKEHALRAILSESGQGLGDIWVDGMLGGVP